LGEKASVRAKKVPRPAQDDVPADLFFLYSTQLKSDQKRCEICGADRLELDLLNLARGLSTSPAWKATPDATLVVRQSSRPALGVVGRFDSAAKARLATLGPQLAAGLSCLRYVSYTQAEEDVQRLATVLIERFGREELRRFRFTAMPRGGFVVLGMLSYALGLRHAQLEPPYPQDVPLVVVDDCAISGYRFNQVLARYGSHQVVFAHLYSHPELRAAIEVRRPQVISCLGARDLYDHAPERYGDEYGAWREQWESRLGDDIGYWLGQPGHLCFSWNEPDVTMWNPTTEKMERGWRIVPPELCLKNGGVHTVEALTVQVQPEGAGPLRPSEEVIFGEFEEKIVVGNTETRASFTLTGVAADMWRCVVEHGNLDEAVASLLREYEVDPSTLRADLQAFVESLLAQDLLDRDGAYSLDG
jgi:hypothetical protein